MNWSNQWIVAPAPITLYIVINPGDFPTPVEAVQVGDLAVHKNLCGFEWWRVTHIPTLTRFNVVPFGLHTQVDLIAWCKKVQANNMEDWKELATLTEESYTKESDAKDRIMNLCLDTEVTSEGQEAEL